MYPNSTVQLIVRQYRERRPDPYVGMKEKGETDKEPYDNEPTILLSWQPARGPYIEESSCASQSIIGTNADGLMAPMSETVIQHPTSKITQAPIIHECFCFSCV